MRFIKQSRVPHPIRYPSGLPVALPWVLLNHKHLNAALRRAVQERIAAHKLLQYDALLIAALGGGCLLGGAWPAPRLLLRGLRQCTLLMTGVYLLSPLLQARS